MCGRGPTGTILAIASDASETGSKAGGDFANRRIYVLLLSRRELIIVRTNPQDCRDLGYRKIRVTIKFITEISMPR